MLTIPTVANRRIKEAVPPRKAWVEAWGFFLLGLGFYLGLACYTYTPFDYTSSGLVAKVSNMAGPWGAYASSEILGRFGIVGMAWPVVFMIWGIFTATGFVVLPKPSRVIGFFTTAATLAGFAEIQLPLTKLPEPSFGFGGVVGRMLQSSFVPQLGYGGALTALAVIGICGLVLSGNITVSKTADFFEYIIFQVRRNSRKFWWKYILNKDSYSNRNSIAASVRVPVPDHPSHVPNMSRGSRGKISKSKANIADEDAGHLQQSAKKAGAGRQTETAESPFGIEIVYKGPAHGKPSPSLFSKSKKMADRSKTFEAQAINLTKQLAEFKIMGKVRKITQGPIVTTYEFEPAPGTKSSKISALGEDLARMLKAQSLRVIAPIPGKDTVGFEVPNQERAIIGFSELVDSRDFRSTKRNLPIAMGVDIFGKPVIEDLAEMPHLLVAGSTGSGKSVFMNTLIGSLICRHSAKDLRLIMVDPKMVEMAAYNGLPHMACPVVTDPQFEALAVLKDLVSEMDERYRRMRALGARNLTSFNEIIRNRRRSEFSRYDGKWQTMPYIVLIIDELADMMMLLGKEVETPITRLAQKARACGIHLVIATQRPSAEVVTGLIKANFPTRVAFRVLSGIDSRTILDQSGAETLLGKGDMLHLSTGATKRVHGAFLSEKEVNAMVRACGKGSRR